MFVEKLDVPLSLTFDDVLLEPQASWLEPAEADTRLKVFEKNQSEYPACVCGDGYRNRSHYGDRTRPRRRHRRDPPEHDARTRSLQEIIFVKQAEELIERDVLFVEDTATVSDAEHLMHQYSIGGVPVVDKGKIIGIVSRRDVRAIVSKRGDEKITSIMTRKPIVADEEITAEKALEIMYTNKVERLPVVNQQRQTYWYHYHAGYS